MVNKKEYLVIFTLLIGICLIMNISASIYFSQQNSVYNLGDFLDLNISINPIVDGPFKLKLFCEDRSTDIFSGPAIENLVLPLNELWIRDLKGNCYFYSNYNGEEVKTNPHFIISSQLNLVLDTDSFFAKPDETIIVSGNVTRINGVSENGEVEILSPFAGISSLNQATNQTNANESNSTSNETVENSTTSTVVLNESKNLGKVYGIVNNGIFSVSLKLPSNSPPGDYVLIINAYDKGSSGNRANQGTINGKLKVPQILKGIDVALNNQIFDPGQNLTVKPSLVDQAGQVIPDSSFVSIKDNKGNVLFEQVVTAGETAVYSIPSDLESAYYSLETSSGEKKVSKTFFVNEKAKVFFEIRNDTLFVKNIGNMRYNKEVKVDINGTPFVKMVDLGVGESKEFYLTGKDGVYNVSATDGENALNRDNVALTGRAIDVKDARAVDIGNLFSNPLIWIFLILIIVVALLLIMNKIIKKRSVAKPHDYYGRPKHLKLDGLIKKETKEIKAPVVLKKKIGMMPVVPPTEAVQGMVTRGNRNYATVIVLKLKNKITPFAKEYVQKSINSIYSRKGAVYEHGEYVVGILSPLVTKSFKNEVDGSKAAEDMCNFLSDYNKKFKEPIQFGIGVNSGEIINEIKEGKLLFTALGNTLVLGKKLAEYSKEDVLLSESVYHRGMSEIQADRKSFGDVIAFKIKRIVDYEKNKKFIDDFLRRAEKDSSGVKYVRGDGYLSRNRVGDGLPTANTLLKDAQKSKDAVVDIPKRDDSISTNYMDFR